MLLWVDASFHEDSNGPLAAAIAVVDADAGVVHVAELVDAATSADTERRAIVAAFKVARTQRHHGSVVIRTDCLNHAKLTPPKYVKLQHADRKGNQAHKIARRVAREEMQRRARLRREDARRSRMPAALRDRPARPAD